MRKEIHVAAGETGHLLGARFDQVRNLLEPARTQPRHRRKAIGTRTGDRVASTDNGD